MIKRFALVLALALMPSAVMAQHHDHAKEAAKPKAEHMNFAKELMAAKADLKLTAEQVTKLEALSVKMDEMHAKMAEMHKGGGEHAAHGAAKPADAAHSGDHAQMEGKLHADLLAVFTEEQLVKVRPLMKAHMEKCEMMMGGQKKAEQHKH
jgi:hypothetical protein